jgi:hypothetical protein
LLLLCAAGTYAQDVRFDKYKLPNNTTVILHEDHTLPIACVNLWYRVGSKDEVAKRSGFAHLFEHLMFGYDRVSAAFDQIMEAGGGWNNASTSEDAMNFSGTGRTAAHAVVAGCRPARVAGPGHDGRSWTSSGRSCATSGGRASRTSRTVEPNWKSTS